VVIAAWQASQTIGRAVSSVLAQTEPAREIVVCDDGSTDDIEGALREFGDRVRLLRSEHRGAGAARNTAAATTTGDFIAVLDADDVWLPGRLERMADLVEHHPAVGLVTTDAWFVVSGERRNRFSESNPFPVRDQATEMLRRNFFFAHVAVRRSLWERHGGFATDLPRAQDWDFWLRLLVAGAVAGCVNEPLAEYTIHEASLSANRAASLWARVEVLDRAAKHQQLTAEQRRVLDTARRTYRRRARLAAAERSLSERLPDRRAASLKLMLDASVPMSTRVRAAAAVLAPERAGARLRHERAVRGRARSDRRAGSG
jgi:glycosyltransferase involved in cell wall biosynthesis